MATTSCSSNQQFTEEKCPTFHQRHPHPTPIITTAAYFLPSVHCQSISENDTDTKESFVSLDKNMGTIMQTTVRANDWKNSKDVSIN